MQIYTRGLLTCLRAVRFHHIAPVVQAQNNAKICTTCSPGRSTRLAHHHHHGISSSVRQRNVFPLASDSFLFQNCPRSSDLLNLFYSCTRNFSGGTGEEGRKTTEGETKLKDTLRKRFPAASNIIVEDISGGCGSMFQIYIESNDFKGMSTVKQHMIVNDALKQEIKSMHGIRIQTAVPK